VTPDIQNSRPPTTEAAIATLEKRLKHKLPVDYRSFLLSHNGGVPSPPTFAPAGATTPTEALNSFLALGGEPGVDDLISFLRIYEARLPAGFVPVAYDAFGNLILLALTGKRRGQVFFWDHEREGEGNPSRLIANDWTSFLESFRAA